jgi:hypothetical protein
VLERQVGVQVADGTHCRPLVDRSGCVLGWGDRVYIEREQHEADGRKVVCQVRLRTLGKLVVVARQVKQR